MEKPKKYDAAKLNAMYQEAETCDYEAFAEMRSNLRLVANDYYPSLRNRLSRNNESRSHFGEARLRISMNHLSVISRQGRTMLVSGRPHAQAVPYNETELQDKKESELSNAVIADCDVQNNMEAKIDEWAKHFIDIGEAYAYVRFDKTKGKFKGYAQKVGQEGQPLFTDQMGQETYEPCDHFGQPHQMCPDKANPVFSGELTVQPILAFNILREPSAESIEDSPWLCIREMVKTADAKALIGASFDGEELKKKLESLKTDGDKSYRVYDRSKNKYRTTSNEVMFKYFYVRPGGDYPKGQYFVVCGEELLFQGDLPFGVFPIVATNHLRVPTECRGYAPIRDLRPAAIEVNRIASTIAEEQLSLGTMVFLQNGSKINKNAFKAGGGRVRVYNVTGSAPTIERGSDGGQYFGYYDQKVNELYQLSPYQNPLEKPQADPTEAMFTRLSQKVDNAPMVAKFERFICDVYKTYLQLAKHYFTDDRLIKAVGKREAINIQEFRESSDDGFEIKLKSRSMDVEELRGKYLMTQNIMQYMGKELDDETRTQLIRNAPFIEKDQVFGRMVINEENVESDMLALERGEWREAHESDNHDFFIARLSHRMKQNDFKTLHPQIQKMYEQRRDQHMQIQTQQNAEMQRAESGLIPTTGQLIKYDQNDENGKRKLIDAGAIQWLEQQLMSQGQIVDQASLLPPNLEAQYIEQSLGSPEPQAAPPGLQQPLIP